MVTAATTLTTANPGPPAALSLLLAGGFFPFCARFLLPVFLFFSPPTLVSFPSRALTALTRRMASGSRLSDPC